MEEIVNCDYKIITIDSEYSNYLNSSYCDFYINLDEPLRNVYKLNLITMLLNIPNNSSLKIPLNQININLNNYNRLISKNNTIIDGKRSNIMVFDSIIVENQITDNTSTNNTTLKNDYNTADSIFYLNPLEPQLIRFSIKLTDKNNNIIQKSDINRFIMKIGVYYNNMKTTRI
jgi:hypothetical protein